ncbi:YihY family inner membrane protein [Neisseria lactamica]|uniref:YihY family inner membrane protein n=1 Tax=Neisseria lactamica TaxID=486 RepID=UPI000E56E16E|nr:YihY family inner membrane protein [Neisseria lactamica]
MTVFSKYWQKGMENGGVAFLLFVARRFSEERVPQAAASMTFTTLLALVPVLTVTVAAVSVFPVFESWSGAFVSFVKQTVVPQGADKVLDYLDAFRRQAGSLTAIGSVMLFVTSLMLVRTIDQAFNRIWRVGAQRPWMMQFLVYWALLTCGPLFLGVGISLTAGWGESWLLRPLAMPLGTVLLLWGLYCFVPNRFVPARHALIGAAATALCLWCARAVFVWYMGSFDGYRSIYGAFAAVPFFLLWLNLLWTLVLGGAVLTASLSYWQGGAFRKNADARGGFDDVLDILLLLDAAQKRGKALRVRQFRRHIGMGYDELGALLDKLAHYGYVYSGRQGWVLKTGADAIKLDILFKRFAYRPCAANQNPVGQAVGRLVQPCLQSLEITLAEFAAQTGQTAPSPSQPPSEG